MKKRKRDKKKRKKLRIWLLIIVLFFPTIGSSEEGVLVSYRAIFYSYKRYGIVARDGSYKTVPEFLIFPFNFIN